jgi:hypothetical protein
MDMERWDSNWYEHYLHHPSKKKKYNVINTNKIIIYISICVSSRENTKL